MAKDEILEMFATSEEDFETDFEESGNIGFDMAITNGKGIPLGSYIILVAGKGSGKTTSCMDMARRILARWEANGQTDNKILYIDIEKSKELAKKVGLSKYATRGSLLYKVGACSVELLEKISKNIIEGKKPYKDIKYIFIDSVNNLICKREIDADTDKGDFGNAVAARNKWYKKYLPELEKLGVTIIGISQFRKKQQATQYEDPHKAALADGDLHWADVILRVSKSTGGNDAETKKVDVFNATTGKTEKISKQFKVTYAPFEDKNRFGKFTSATSLVTYGEGCHNWFAMKQLLVSHGFMENKGSAASPKWNFSPDLITFVGAEATDLNKAEMREYLADNMKSLKDFLRSKDCYCNSKDMGESDDEE